MYQFGQEPALLNKNKGAENWLKKLALTPRTDDSFLSDLIRSLKLIDLFKPARSFHIRFYLSALDSACSFWALFENDKSSVRDAKINISLADDNCRGINRMLKHLIANRLMPSNYISNK